MKRIIIISCLLFSCAQPKEQVNSKEEDKREINIVNSDSSHEDNFTNNTSNSANNVLVELSSDIKFTWDSANKIIVKDSLFKSIRKDYPSKKIKIIELIKDSKATSLKVCSQNLTLRKGDLAFLLIEEFELIPYFEIFKLQFDVYEQNCPFPLGLSEYINNNRVEVYSKVKDYILGGDDQSFSHPKLNFKPKR